MSSPGVPGQPPHRSDAVPPPLQVAAALAGLEAFALIVQALSLVPAIEGQRLSLGLTTVTFFLLYGGALAWCAWHLRGRQSWARSFVVFAQLVQLGVAWSFRGEPTTFVAVTMAAMALFVLAGIFHPQSVRAMATD